MDNQTQTVNLENTKIAAVPTNPQSNPLPPPPQIIPKSHDELIKALYWIWDAFDRVTIPMFLVGQTALDALKNHDLTGDKVEVGVRRMEWTSGNKQVLDNFIQPISEDGNKAQYDFEGILVIVHIYDDADCIMNLDSKMYRHERFFFPNPYKDFVQLYE